MGLFDRQGLLPNGGKSEATKKGRDDGGDCLDFTSSPPRNHMISTCSLQSSRLEEDGGKRQNRGLTRHWEDLLMFSARYSSTWPYTLAHRCTTHPSSVIPLPHSIIASVLLSHSSKERKKVVSPPPIIVTALPSHLYLCRRPSLTKQIEIKRAASKTIREHLANRVKRNLPFAPGRIVPFFFQISPPAAPGIWKQEGGIKNVCNNGKRLPPLCRGDVRARPSSEYAGLLCAKSSGCRWLVVEAVYCSHRVLEPTARMNL